MNREVQIEARILQEDLLRLRARGRRLLKSDVSTEAAAHFVEIANLHMRGLSETVSLERVVEPREQIEATLEGMGSLINKIATFFKKNKESKAGEQKETAEEQAAFLKSLEDKSALADRHVKVDKIVVSRNLGGLLTLDGKPVDDPLSAIKKQIDEYRSIFNKVKDPCKKFNEWADKTWVGAEKEFEKLGNDADDYSSVIRYIKERAKVRPPYPSEVVSIPDHARLGYSSPDKWIVNNPSSAKGSKDLIFNPKYSDYLKVEVSVAPISIEQTGKAIELYSKTFDLWTEIYEESDEIGGNGDFTDYPYRNDVFSDQLFEECDGHELSYDSQALNDLANPFFALDYRVDEMLKVLYALIRASYK